jgi:5-methylcytosine-specific restriction protein A
MKLSNFLRYDATYQGSGLSRGNKIEEEVWNEFAHDYARLRKLAATIRDNALHPPEDLPITNGDEMEEAVEGALLTRVHRSRERASGLVQAKKNRMRRETGYLRCEVCGFDFEAVYGELGSGFAECHHTKPLADLRSSEKTKVADLAILCANCHRMIHRRRPWLSLQGLRNLLRRA